MSNNQRPLIIRNLKVLGIYQLLGGLGGITLIIFSVFGAFDYSAMEILLLLSGTLLFGFSILCGVLCFRKEKYALELSRINQCLQLVMFVGQKIAFVYVAGFGLYVGVNLEHGLGFTGYLKTIELSFTFFEGSGGKILACNLVALYLLYNLNVLIKERKQDDEQLFDM